MAEASVRTRGAALKLSSSAPQIRITAGVGSTAQKTWNLRRAVTLIGSRRPAGIVLHDREVSQAHCVIVNTGSDVLLKDLHTQGGTYRNQERVNFIVLSDGDVVRIGATSIQIAICVPRNTNDDSGSDLEFIDPKRFPQPFEVTLEHTDRRWRVDDAVVLVGRHERAEINLDHESISVRHAIFFRFGRQPAVFDLGSRTGTLLNGAVASPAVVTDGDTIQFGSLGVVLHGVQPSTAPPVEWRDPPRDELPIETPAEANPDLTHIAEKLAALEENIGASWNRLNTWDQEQQSRDAAQAAAARDLEERAAALEAKDAMLRGYMHDVTRYRDELCSRERELAAQVARMQAQQDELTSTAHALDTRQAEVDRRAEEMKRREHVLAQRWARLAGTTCPHCDQPINASAPQ